MPIVATLITSQEPPASPPRIRETRTGTEGTRFYRVNTHREERALTAMNLPAMFEAWSAERPTLKVAYREAVHWMGTDDGSTEEGGWSIVEVGYDVPGSGLLPPPEEGLTYTRLTGGTEGTQLLYDIRAEDNPPEGPLNPNDSTVQDGVTRGGGSIPQPGGTSSGNVNAPIRDGAGAIIEIGYTRAEVVCYYPLSGGFGQIPLTQMIDFRTEQYVNDAPIRLPALFGTSGQYTVGIGKARYHDFAVENEGGLIRVTHVVKLGIAPGFELWRPKGKYGAPAPSVGQIGSQKYWGNTFSGLWPGI